MWKLEARPEPDLPDHVVAPHALRRLDVAQRVPERGRARVAVPEQRVVARRGLVKRQPELLAEPLDDDQPAGVQAEVVEGAFKVRDVGRGAHRLGQERAHDE